MYLNRRQAEVLASDLREYVKLKDSSARDVFSGFWLSIDSDNLLCLEPIPNYTLIESDEKEIENIHETISQFFT